MQTIYRLTPHETLTLLHSEPALLTVEARWTAEAAEPLAHLHPRQEERFEVLEGSLRVTRAGVTEVFEAGETFSVAAGVAHAMGAAGEDGARARWEIRSALATETMFAALDAATSRLDQLRVLARHRGEFRLTAPPDPVQRALFALIRALPGG